jgi:sec-independent protein translocase protein TatA
MSSSDAILASFMNFSGGELMIVLLIILVLFGGSKLPSLAKGLGQSMKEFKKASKDDDDPVVTPPKEELKKPDTAGTPGTN